MLVLNARESAGLHAIFAGVKWKIDTSGSEAD